MPMKILFLGISGYEYPHVRVRCYRFAEQLRANGIDAEVLSFKDHLASHYSESEMYGLRDRDRVRLVFKSLPRLWRSSDSILYLQKLHYHTAGAQLLIRWLNRPFILDYDDYDIGTDHHGSGLFCGFNRPLLNRFFYGHTTDYDILEQSARKACACIAASHYLLEILKPFNPNVFYVPTGADTQRFTPSVPPVHADRSEIILLWTGIIWGEAIAENLYFLADVLMDVRIRFPNVKLRIVGQGESLNNVIAYFSELNLMEALEIIHWVPPDQMPFVLQEADIGLLPMIKDTPWTRSKSPTKLFEYLAAGLPVVASPTGEVNHVIRNGQNGCLASDRDQFAAAILRFCEDPEWRSRIAGAARRSAETEFSQDILGKRLAMILTEKLHLT